MLTVGSLAFLNPWLLAALLTLPALWFLLRATPPSPRRLAFPGVRLLLGLEESERMPDRTPWWLLLLRLAMIAALIFAFARPVLNPARPLAAGTGPVLVLMDGGWASAPDWEARRARALEALEQADRAGRAAAFRLIAEPFGPEEVLALRPAADWMGAAEGALPRPWAPDRAGFIPAVQAFAAAEGAEGFDVIYLHDGLSHGGEDGLADALADLAALTMIGPEDFALALRPPTLLDGALSVEAVRAEPGGPRPVAAVAIGRGPEGEDRRLAIAEAEFAEGETIARLSFDLPLELRNRVRRVALLSGASAGGVTLADDAVRRKRVGLLSGAAEEGARPLTSQLHYLRQALVPTAQVSEGPIPELIESGADAIILADVGTFPGEERAALTEWVEGGGLLIRFAGPRTARASSEARALSEDPLLPVRLRAGGRAVGGALSWGAPQPVAPFPDGSPFAGLTPPEEVKVSRQVLSQPGPELAERTVASLRDGTPLVTMARRGEGRVILFHVTANAEWSSLPLSGLFVQMLERLAVAAGTGGAEAAAAADPERVWTPVALLDGFGREGDPTRVAGVSGARLAEGRPGPDAPPGVYQDDDRIVALNVAGAEAALTPAPPPPPGAAADSLGRGAERDLKGLLLALAALLLALDALAALWVSGRLSGMGRPRRAAGLALAALLAGAAAAPGARAQAIDFGPDIRPAPVPGVDGPAFGRGAAPEGPGAAARARADDARAIAATTDTVMAYVITGDAAVDRMSEAGLRGLSRVLSTRTAVEPADPIGVDLERDELAFFPMLYWPVTTKQSAPSDAAYEKLNAFTRTGGMIVFDTRDAHLSAGMAAGTPEGRALRRLAAPLDLPPLEPTPKDHVLTRTFYLLSDFPGRWTGGETWLEAAAEPDSADGRPFRNLNDGVTPVIIGANDWAAAWAVDAAGSFVAPTTSLRQREMAFRFGVNLMMYVLTGSYKSDQVHVPALLERLGN